MLTPLRCEKHDRLLAEVRQILEHLVKLTRSQSEAFQRDDRGEFKRLDRELELAVGEKERRVGALREHESEHRCQPTRT